MSDLFVQNTALFRKYHHRSDGIRRAVIAQLWAIAEAAQYIRLPLNWGNVAELCQHATIDDVHRAVDMWQFQRHWTIELLTLKAQLPATEAASIKFPKAPLNQSDITDVLAVIRSIQIPFWKRWFGKKSLSATEQNLLYSLQLAAAESPFRLLDKRTAELEQQLGVVGCTIQNSPYINDIPKDEGTKNRFLWVLKAPVTQALYHKVMQANPSTVKKDDYPVESVRWREAIQFCNALSEYIGVPPVYQIVSDAVYAQPDGLGYRLLTEAEWAYCAQAGESYRYSGGDDVLDVAWIPENSQHRLQAVGQKNPNAFGLVDMSGLVREWCWDVYSTQDDARQIVEHSRKRVVRGGSFMRPTIFAACASRDKQHPEHCSADLGFRICRSLS